MASCFLHYDSPFVVRRLPKVCMKCGREATEYMDLECENLRKGAGVLGLVLDATGVNDGPKANVIAPLCGRHPFMGLMLPAIIVSVLLVFLAGGLTALVIPAWIGLWFVLLFLSLMPVLMIYTFLTDIHIGKVEQDGVRLWGVSRRFVAEYEKFTADRPARAARRECERLHETWQSAPGEKPTLHEDGTITDSAEAGGQPKRRKRKRKRKRYRFLNSVPEKHVVLREVGILGAAWAGAFLLAIITCRPWTAKVFKQSWRKTFGNKPAAGSRNNGGNWFGPVAGNNGNANPAGNGRDPNGKLQQGNPAKVPVVPGKPASPLKIDGLIAYWPFDEGRGAAARDRSAAQLTATIHNGRWIDGRLGKGVWLAGENCYVELARTPSLNFAAGKPFTFSVWTATKENEGPIVSFRNTRSGAPVIDVRVAKGQLAADVRADGTQFGVASLATAPLADGRWHHVALTRAADGTIALFLDGKEVGRTKGRHSAGPITTNLRTLGSERYWATIQKYGRPHFTGGVDEFAIFDRELSGGEIRALAGSAD
jgi:Concanavalin A-like lectin/glucanases superfamily